MLSAGPCNEAALLRGGLDWHQARHVDGPPRPVIPRLFGWRPRTRGVQGDVAVLGPSST